MSPSRFRQNHRARDGAIHPWNVTASVDSPIPRIMVASNESSRPPRPACLFGRSPAGAGGRATRARRRVRRQVLPSGTRLLLHRLPLSSPFLPCPRGAIRHDPRRATPRDLRARQFAPRATDRRHLLRADLTSARSPAASLRAHPASASVLVGGRNIGTKPQRRIQK